MLSTELADEDFNGLDIITVETALREIAEEFSGDDGWILSSSLGARLARRLPDFDTRNFGFKKFVPFIESLSFFESKSVKESENSEREDRLFPPDRGIGLPRCLVSDANCMLQGSYRWLNRIQFNTAEAHQKAPHGALPVRRFCCKQG